MISELVNLLHNPAVIKFLKAIGGVAVSSLVIYIGLKIYNNIFKKSITPSNGDFLKPPETVEDAINFFINKNRIK